METRLMQHHLLPRHPRRRPTVVAATFPTDRVSAARMNLLRWLVVLSALALVAAIAAPVRAQIHDNANLFSPQAEQKAMDAIQQLKQRHHRTLLVETFPTVPPEKRAELQAKGKDKFFEDWTNER